MRRYIPLLSTMLVHLVLSTPTPARAEESPRARAEAREHFERGVEMVRQERWEEGLAEFDESLALYPTQAALYNRGLCLRYLRRYQEAIETFERYLERYGDRVPASRRRGAEEELDSMRELVGRLDLELEGPSSAEVYVDGVLTGRAPLAEPLVVGPGRHSLEVRAEGYEDFTTEFTLSSGGEVTLPVVMTRAEGGAGGPGVDGRDEAAPAGRRRGLRISGLALVGVAVAALGTALGLYLWNNGRYEDWELTDQRLRSQYGSLQEEPTDEAELWSQVESHNDELEAIRQIDGLSWGLLGVGIAAAATSAVLLVLGFRSEGSGQVSVMPRDGGLMIAAGWRFP